MANTGTTDAPSIEYTPIKEDDVYPDNWKPDYYSYLPGKMYKTNYPNSPTPA
jgi:hypothetical protein